MGSPFCLCVAGPNGSGKSTFARLVRNQVEFWIDPDELPGSDVAAFRQGRNLRVQYAKRNESFAFETVFSHGSNLAFLRALKALGYEVHLYFVCTESAEINVSRVAARVRLGGHTVDEDRIRDRYQRALTLLSLSIKEMDRCFLLDNSRTAETRGLTIGGRLVAQTWGDEGGAKDPHIEILPPLSAWALQYGIFPYADRWERSPPGRKSRAFFGRDIEYRGDLRGLGTTFLDQFLNPGQA